MKATSKSSLSRVSSKLPPMDCWDEYVSGSALSPKGIAKYNPPRSRTVSPSLPEPPSNSFEEWQKDNDWDEVVFLGDDDHECHFQDSPSRNNSIILDGSAVIGADHVPSIDEFLVKQQSDNMEIDIGETEELDLPTSSSGSKGDTEMPGSDCSMDFRELYRKTLTNLKESMKKSQKSRSCLKAMSANTTTCPRRHSICQVLHRVETSSRQIDQCLDPDFFQRRSNR